LFECERGLSLSLAACLIARKNRSNGPGSSDSAETAATLHAKIDIITSAT
jgi:hypothetical protein